MTSTSYTNSELVRNNIGSFVIDDTDGIEERFDALEKELGYLFRRAPFGLHTLDANHVFSSINDQALTWLGYRETEIIGRLKFTDVLTPESQKKYLSHIAHYHQAGFAEDIELALIAKNQAIRHVTLYSTAFISAEGVLTKHRGVLFNIEDRKAMEAQLNIAETTFESQEGMIVTDTNNLVLRVNQAFTNITGYSNEEAIGKPVSFLNSGRQDKEFYSGILESLNKTGTWEGELWNRRKSGEVYPEHLTVTAVKNSTGVVTNYVASLRDITERKAASDEIRNLAYFDPLTKLPNRRLLLDRLKQVLAKSAQNASRGALLFFDLDNFKALNDTLGHNFGDLLLQMVAERIKENATQGSTVARIGGDEFVVLIEDLSEHAMKAAAQTKNVAERISSALNEPYRINSQTYHSVASVGATLFDGHESAIDELLKQADIAMYQSKIEGSNTLRFYDPMMQEAITKRVELERELRVAIEKKQFILHYQIQVDSNCQALGAEALVRWLHPDRGMISPDSFIPIAEETGLILPIGQWVLTTACARLKVWQRSPLTRDLVLAVNVSAKQFNQADFVAQVLDIVKQHEIDPTRLKLEITESLLVKNIQDIVTKMTALSKIGIRFSLDDFGTGYSSLQYLKMLPLNQLKIDRSFVRDITTDSSDRAIVRTIITMAHGLDIDVIAEGVETAEQQQFLLDNGCSHSQGYLFGRPVPIDEFEAALKKSHYL